MKEAAEDLGPRLGISGVSWQAPNLAVTFANPGEERVSALRSRMLRPRFTSGPIRG
jgi:hypothetical protein